MKAKAKEITPPELAELIRRHPRVVALTGAGISVESGIPDFRSAGGLWSRFDPMEYAYIRAFRRNPAKVWAMLKEMDAVITRARPNPAHHALAELEAKGYLTGIITQNVDNLHQEAGSKRVVEYHGNALRFVCDTCRGHHPRESLDFSRTPLYCLCGGLIRPDVVFFGEPIPPRPRPRPKNWPSTATCSWSSAPPAKWPRPATSRPSPKNGAPSSWRSTWNPPASPIPSPITSSKGPPANCCPWYCKTFSPENSPGGKEPGIGFPACAENPLLFGLLNLIKYIIALSTRSQISLLVPKLYLGTPCRPLPEPPFIMQLISAIFA